jgi:hypothetical protein
MSPENCLIDPVLNILTFPPSNHMSCFFILFLNISFKTHLTVQKNPLLVSKKPIDQSSKKIHYALTSSSTKNKYFVDTTLDFYPYSWENTSFKKSECSQDVETEEVTTNSPGNSV